MQFRQIAPDHLRRGYENRLRVDLTGHLPAFERPESARPRRRRVCQGWTQNHPYPPLLTTAADEPDIRIRFLHRCRNL